jgi:hypothetical protein
MIDHVRDRILLSDAVEMLCALPDHGVGVVVMTNPPYGDLRRCGGVWSGYAHALGYELIRVRKDGANSAVAIGDASRSRFKSLSSILWSVD